MACDVCQKAGRMCEDGAALYEPVQALRNQLTARRRPASQAEHNEFHRVKKRWLDHIFGATAETEERPGDGLSDQQYFDLSKYKASIAEKVALRLKHGVIE